MKSFDTKINCFGGQNLPQWLFSLFKVESDNSFPLYPRSKKGLKKKKNKVSYQNIF